MRPLDLDLATARPRNCSQYPRAPSARWAASWAAADV